MSVYVKEYVNKVLRIKHAVTVFGSVGSLKRALNDIPDNVELSDVDEDKQGRTVLVFVEEKAEAQP